jgi:hypothetical protein
MFDLEREVAAWSAALHADRCGSAAAVAEVVDHLYCEIDRARSEGLSDEQAFRAAVSRLGARTELAGEAAKNRSLLARGCAAAMRYDRSVASAEQRWLFMAHALLWAALMLGTSLIISKSATSRTLGVMLTGALTSAWWVSQQILQRALCQKGARGAE